MSGTARAWWYSLWIHEDAVGRGFPKLIHLGWWIFPTLAFQKRFMRPDIHGHKQIFTFRTCHGPAMVFEYYLTFCYFFIYLFLVFGLGGGEWKGVPWLGMWILAASGHPWLSFLWGAADCTWWTLQPLLVRSTSWRLAPGMAQELGTWEWVDVVGNSSNGYPSKIGHVQRNDQQKPLYLDLSLRHHSSTWQGLPSTWWDCATCLSCRTGGGTCGCCSLSKTEIDRQTFVKKCFEHNFERDGFWADSIGMSPFLPV